LAPEEPPSKIQCPLCDQDFAFKGQRDAHLKSCKREVNRLMTIQASRMPEHSAMCNRWLWSRPPADPIMQQNMRKQQQPVSLKLIQILFLNFRKKLNNVRVDKHLVLRHLFRSPNLLH
jgi:hypothetical protein